jgi:hypothetical protein
LSRLQARERSTGNSVVPHTDARSECVGFFFVHFFCGDMKEVTWNRLERERVRESCLFYVSAVYLCQISGMPAHVRRGTYENFCRHRLRACLRNRYWCMRP